MKSLCWYLVLFCFLPLSHGGDHQKAPDNRQSSGSLGEALKELESALKGWSTIKTYYGRKNGAEYQWESSDYSRGQLKIRYNGNEFTMDTDRFPAGPDWDNHYFAWNDKSKALLLSGQSEQLLLNWDLKTVISCAPLPDNTYVEKLFSYGEGFLLAAISNEALVFFRVEVTQGKCSTTPIPITKKYDHDMTIEIFKDSIFIAREHYNPKSHSHESTIEQIRLPDGNSVKNWVVDGVSTPSSGGPLLQVGERGILLGAAEDSDSEQVNKFFWIKPDGSRSKLSTNTQWASWIPEGGVLLSQGEHAWSSSLKLLKGENLTRSISITQPEGYKSDFRLSGDTLTYLNFNREEGYSYHQVNLSDPSSDRVLDNSPNMKKFPFHFVHWPKIKMVEYSSAGGRVVPSVLHLPHKECTENEKLPAVLYLHGGGAHGYPTGHNHNGDDEFFLNQINQVVLSANYHGDDFQGEKYDSGGSPLVQVSAYDRQLEDIAAAIQYLSTLPCVDKAKISIFGQSFGAMIASVFITEPRYHHLPLSSVVLRGGAYDLRSRDSDRSAALWTPRIAYRGTELNKDVRWHGMKGVDLKIYIPEENGRAGLRKKIYDVEEAQKLLRTLEKEGEEYDGVLYHLPDSYFDRVLAVRRTENVRKIPILLLAGQAESDDYAQAQKLEKLLKAKGVPVSSWYPEEGDHYFTGKVRLEMLPLLKSFFDSAYTKSK